MTSSSKRLFECRFGVGDPNGTHSGTWKVWASRNAPDLYIAARSIAKQQKISIHASGQRHSGYTSEHVRRMTDSGNWVGRSRHIEKWTGGVETNTPSCTVEFRARFPADELRAYPLPQEKPSKRVNWIPRPAPGHSVEVVLLIAPAGKPKGWPGQINPGTQLIAKGKLSDGRNVLLVYFTEPCPPLSNQEEIEHRIRIEAANLGVTPANVTGGHRIIMFGDTKEGGKACVEYALDSFLRD